MILKILPIIISEPEIFIPSQVIKKGEGFQPNYLTREDVGIALRSNQTSKSLLSDTLRLKAVLTTMLVWLV